MRNNSLKYFSTNRRSPEVTFGEALLKGIAPDGGLYLPSSIPVLSEKELKSLTGKLYPQIASSVLSKIIDDRIDEEELTRLCDDAYNFDVPLEKITERKYIMRLDQGPTASFKDFAARMMSRLMQYYLALNNKHLLILTATSGDTGSAVANAFYDLANIKVVILYPKDEVTDIQRKQMTTLNKNINVIAIDGKFDDCQFLVKKAFGDKELLNLNLSSANSINIGRLLPQSVYYFYAWAKLSENLDDKIIFSVPSGNFGNLMGGILAGKMGLPVKQFIVATNENDEVPEFLKTGDYKPVAPSRNCLSSAMNVGHPSNLARIIELYGGNMDEKGNILKSPDLKKLREDLFSVSVSDTNTKLTIGEVYNEHKVIIEPHGATAWYGIKDYCRSNNPSETASQLFVSVETAHPSKFSDEVKNVLNIYPPIAKVLEGIEEKPEHFIPMENNYTALRDYLKKNF